MLREGCGVWPEDVHCRSTRPSSWKTSTHLPKPSRQTSLEFVVWGFENAEAKSSIPQNNRDVLGNSPINRRDKMGAHTNLGSILHKVKHVLSPYMQQGERILGDLVYCSQHTELPSQAKAAFYLVASTEGMPESSENWIEKNRGVAPTTTLSSHPS